MRSFYLAGWQALLFQDRSYVHREWVNMALLFAQTQRLFRTSPSRVVCKDGRAGRYGLTAETGDTFLLSADMEERVGTVLSTKIGEGSARSCPQRLERGRHGLVHKDGRGVGTVLSTEMGEGSARSCPQRWERGRHGLVHRDGRRVGTVLSTKMGEGSARSCPQRWEKGRYGLVHGDGRRVGTVLSTEMGEGSARSCPRRWEKDRHGLVHGDGRRVWSG